uniref:Uncharacterized protein n=1 Tax=uncultured haloarchaeon TaxID=160804 RepID=A5YSQ2_9EURY|nr:hypothetical protein [uncultured haloarchaeon]
MPYADSYSVGHRWIALQSRSPLPSGSTGKIKRHGIHSLTPSFSLVLNTQNKYSYKSVINLTYYSPDTAQEWLNSRAETIHTDAQRTEEWLNEIGIDSTTNQWLVDQTWKRALSNMIYKDLLATDSDNQRVVEIGGDLNAITLKLAKQHDYTLIETAHHEGPQAYTTVEDELGESFVTLGDWSSVVPPNEIDVLIANDLFPNVDNRLYEFIDTYLPRTSELRLALTYYENKSFEVERTETGEHLFVRAWGVREIRHWLEYLQQEWPSVICSYETDAVKYKQQPQLFDNDRNIIQVTITKEESA